MKIVSLYDGMACGMLAMLGAGVNVESYDAYEIDKNAIQTATHNFPQIVEHGDVFDAKFSQYKDIDFMVGGSPCFTKGHFVLTDSGYKDISEIKVGDYVLTHTKSFKKVLRVNQREAEIYDLNIMGYPTFRTTANHPFYTIERSKCNYRKYVETHSWREFTTTPKWTEVEELTSDHFCGQHIFETKGYNTFNIDKDLAYILGRYVADGHIRKTKRNGRVSSFQYQVVLSIGASKIEKFKSHITTRHYSCYEHSQSVYRCVFSSKELLDFIEQQGFGKRAYAKNIPEFIFDLPKDVQIAFLNGYIDGDGCYVASFNEYCLSTVSPRLAFGLQRLITNIYKTNVSVIVSDNQRAHKIGEREIKSNYPLYTVKFKKGLRKQSVAHIQNDIIWTQVRSIRNTNKIDTVYNIEVEDDNSYTINNCIVHNCTYWSIAQKNNRETEASGMGWELFSQYVRALREIKPKFFIYENNKSMSKAIRDSITETFGFEPICINSALVSAQNRQRLYWVGKLNENGTYDKVDVQQPADRGILLKDVLDDAVDLTSNDKSYALTASYEGAVAWNTIERHQRTMCAVPVNITNDGKAQCVRATIYKDGIRNMVGNDIDKRTCIAEPCCIQEQVHGRKAQPDGSYDRRYEARIDSKSGTLTGTNRQNSVALPLNTTSEGKSQTIKTQYQRTSIANICKYTSTYGASGVAEKVHDKPNQVGSLPRPNGELSTSQGFRIYDIDNKGVSFQGNAGGAGGKTGLYAIPIEFENGEPVKAVSQTDDKTYTVYTVANGKITIKGKEYPIKLQDGYYIIRKLSVSECKRLQTVPEWYEFPVSKSAAYKMLGNGWSVDVIVHLIKACLREAE